MTNVPLHSRANVTHPRETLPYVFVSMLVAGRGAEVPRLICASCNAHADLAPVYGPANKEGLLRKWRRLGWETDGRHPRKNRCPSCAGTATKLGDIVKDQQPMPPLEATVPASAPQMTQSQPNLKVVTPPTPTPQQRAAIRRLLDATFDDAKGMYLDNYSDQRIGTEVGIAWAAVKQLREMAYGPIRTDPQVEGFLAAVEAAQAELSDITRSLTVVRQQTDELQRRYESVRTTLDRLSRDSAELKNRYR